MSQNRTKSPADGQRGDVALHGDTIPIVHEGASTSDAAPIVDAVSAAQEVASDSHTTPDDKLAIQEARIARIRARYSQLRRNRRERKWRTEHSDRLKADDRHWDDPYEEQLFMVKDSETKKYRVETRPGLALPAEVQDSPPRKKLKFMEWDSDEEETLSEFGDRCEEQIEIDAAMKGYPSYESDEDDAYATPSDEGEQAGRVETVAPSDSSNGRDEQGDGEDSDEESHTDDSTDAVV